MDKPIAAVTHPGKMGDALYALPYARWLAQRYGPVDFYTSEYCRPMVTLLRYQSYINRVIIPENYAIQRMDMGVQPWGMPVEDGYKIVAHCGFRRTPDTALPAFIAQENGCHDPMTIKYEFPEPPYELRSDFIVMAPRGETTFKSLFLDIIKKSPVPVYIIGGAGDYIGAGEDFTYLDMLFVLPYLRNSRGFIGIGSSQLVLANGFDIPKVIPHHGFEYDMRHFIYTDRHHYLVNPTAEDVLARMNI